MESTDQYGKVCWRSRRGMLELDRVLVPFVQHHYLKLTQTDQALYQELLAHEDADLADWLIYGVPTPNSQLQKIISLIIEHVPSH